MPFFCSTGPGLRRGDWQQKGCECAHVCVCECVCERAPVPFLRSCPPRSFQRSPTATPLPFLPFPTPTPLFTLLPPRVCSDVTPIAALVALTTIPFIGTLLFMFNATWKQKKCHYYMPSFYHCLPITLATGIIDQTSKFVGLCPCMQRLMI